MTSVDGTRIPETPASRHSVLERFRTQAFRVLGISKPHPKPHSNSNGNTYSDSSARIKYENILHHLFNIISG